MIKLISDLVSFKTVYPQYDQFDKCISYIKNYFKDSKLFIKEYEFNKDKSLVISNSESKELDIIFCGHIDVVPADDSMFEVRQDGDILYGRGVSDMKGQDAVMMELMRTLDSNKKIALFLTSDEERGGFNGTQKLLQDEGYSCKVAIAPDGGFDFQLVSDEKGVLQLKMSMTGIECHSSEPYKGENAIVKLFHIYNRIIEKYPLPKNENDFITSVNLAKFEGGTAVNKVPNNASMYLDIRHIYTDSKEKILEFIKNLSQDLKIEILAQGEVFHVDNNNPYIQKYIETCNSVLNISVDIIGYPAASDARFFTQKGIPCIIMNPIGGNIHCSDEFVNVESFEKLLQIYKEYIKNI